jgi:hypothetical protein
MTKQQIEYYAKKFFGHMQLSHVIASVCAVLRARRIAIVGSAVVLAATVTATAQSTNQPPSFFNTALSYFTSFNTNLDSTFADAKGSIWTGVDSMQGARTPLANALGLSYRVYDLISLESVTRNAGVAGTVVSQQFGPSLNFIVHDAKLTLYTHAGYELDAPSGSKLKDKIFGEIGVRVCKALTAHTFAGVGVGAQLPKNTQVFQAFAGITF